MVEALKRLSGINRGSVSFAIVDVGSHIQALLLFFSLLDEEPLGRGWVEVSSLNAATRSRRHKRD